MNIFDVLAIVPFFVTLATMQVRAPPSLIGALQKASVLPRLLNHPPLIQKQKILQRFETNAMLVCRN